MTLLLTNGPSFVYTPLVVCFHKCMIALYSIDVVVMFVYLGLFQRLDSESTRTTRESMINQSFSYLL